MARFLVKASEFKNVCKAVNDRKLAELKKEIIEILKKQDEKEVKKAIDYFESQELHYTHLEKSFNGKWVEKAGYSVGTVRIWKGKKYKKIAPGKWARVFEKEGRGTNIAIGKLIAKVQKIDNVEDLMAFVMANKQRFVDENGVDLPVLDKLRAAVDARNGSVGSKTSGLKLSDKELERLKEQNMTVENLRHKGYTDEEIKEFAKPKASKEEIRYQVVSGYENKSQNEIDKDLAYLKKQAKFDDSMTVSLVGSEKMPIKDAIEILKDIKKNNNTKAALKEVEDAIDNAGDYDDIEELEKERKQLLKKLGKKPAEKYDAKAYEEEKNNVLRHTNKDYDSVDAALKDMYAHKNWIDRKPSDETEHEKTVRESRLKAVDDIIEGLKNGDKKLLDKFVKDSKQTEKKSPEKLLKEMGFERMEKVSFNGEKWEVAGVSLDYNGNVNGISLTPDRQAGNLHSSNVTVFDIDKIQKNKPAEKKESDFDIDSIKGQTGAVAMLKDQMETWPKEKLTEYYNDKLEKIKNNKVPSVAMQNVKNQFVAAKELLNEKYKNDESEAEKTKNEESNSEDIKRAKEKIKQYAGKKINSNEISDIKILDDGERSGFLTFEFKSGNDKYKMTYDNGFGGEKGGVSIKKIESEESETENHQNRSDAVKMTKEEKKVIENNPKSIEGMEFVNKNKMHVLANFLANHDNVNMATAVIRLQAAYEKLGEEKFLAHFPKDVVERYRKEAGKEEPKKKSFTPISKDKMKSMSDDELKDYEAKLEKDLLATSRTDPDYVEKYNHWREVHGENNDRFHQRIEDEARAEKQAEADAKAQKENEIKERYNGYFDGKKGLDKARDLKLLEKKYNFEGKGVMTSKDFVEQAIDNGEEIREREVNKLDYPSRTRWNRMNNYEQEQYEKRIKAAGKKMLYSIGGYEFPKGVVDYAKFYKEKGKSKSGNEKPSKSETAIKNKATSLAGAFGYSKTYATKMGSPFNLELAEQTVDEELDWDDGSKKALKEELRRIYSEKKVQKSLFDDFVMDMLVDEDEEDFEVRKIDESLWNDYSAEQPELFNSTELMVREAFNRCRVL